MGFEMNSVRRTAPRLLIPVTERDPAAWPLPRAAHAGEGAVDLAQTRVQSHHICALALLSLPYIHIQVLVTTRFAFFSLRKRI